MGDLDLTLRHVARGMPLEFARGVLGPTVPVEVLGWQDTVVARQERRLDRVLSVRVDGRPRWLHVEWQSEWTRELPYRVYEYQGMLSMAQREPSPKLPRVPVESTVVLLSGRSKPYPPWGRFRVSPRDSPFSGARFRIDAVYQQSHEALMARRSLLWLVLAPLAANASEDTVKAAVMAARERARSRAELAEVVTAMEVVAGCAPRGPRLQEVLMGLIDEGMLERSLSFQKGQERGRTEGEKLGRSEGEKLGRSEGEKLGRSEGLGPLLHLFERRIGRDLTVAERETLRQRLDTVGPARLGDVVLDLEPADLAVWIADPDAR